MENSNPLEKYPVQKLSELIEVVDEKGKAKDVGQIEGVNIEKSFVRTVANLEKSDLSKYKTVPSNAFACNLMHIGRDFTVPVAFNSQEKCRIVSPAYAVFRVKDEEKLMPIFLFTQLNSKEFDRKLWFNTDGSVRGNLTWEDMCRVKIPLPPIEVQRAYVKAYQGLSTLIEQNEALVKELEKTAQACIVECREKWPLREVGDFIQYIRKKNSDRKITLEQGVNIKKQFITPQRSNSDLSTRVVVKKGQFAYCTQLNNENVAIALRQEEDCVVSPVYAVFEVISPLELLPEFLFLCLKRSEFGRFVYWASVGSAYEFLTEESLRRYQIPLPPIEVQRAIVALYTCAEEARKIASEAKELLKKACPAMVQSAAHHKTGVI